MKIWIRGEYPDCKYVIPNLNYLGSIVLKAEKSVLFGNVCVPVCPRSLAKKLLLEMGSVCKWKDSPLGWMDEYFVPVKFFMMILSPTTI